MKVDSIPYTEDDALVATAEDVENSERKELKPDLAIAGDGASSRVGKLLFPETEAEYAGYVTWRSVVPKQQLSSETRGLLKDLAVRYNTDVWYVAFVFPPLLRLFSSRGIEN